MKPSGDTASKAVKKFARKLLTTTCLTAAAAGAAHAGTIFNESSVAGGDFSNTFAGANLLPLGTTEVIGQINPNSDIDFFEFTGLLGGSGYTITGIGYEGAGQYGVLSSADVYLNPLADSPTTMSGTVPGDGILVVQAQHIEQTANYDLALTAQSSAPEPSTMGVVGLGLAGAWVLRRRRKA